MEANQIYRKCVGGVKPHYVCNRMKGSGKITIEKDVGDYACLLLQGPEVIIKGSAGWNAGCDMKAGEMIVEGDTGSFVGSGLHDGKITVYGNTEDYAGYNMVGGNLTIYGNAKEFVGKGSKAGSIYLNGDFESIADDACADIYWNNRKVGVPEYATTKAEIDRCLEELNKNEL